MRDYTKGGWSVDPSSLGDIIAYDGELIASAFPMDSGLEQEQYANARLIAAAPSLLEALKGTLDLNPGAQFSERCRVAENARAAIASAEGAPDA